MQTKLKSAGRVVGSSAIAKRDSDTAAAPKAAERSNSRRETSPETRIAFGMVRFIRNSRTIGRLCLCPRPAGHRQKNSNQR
jgi:hypothetical protein